MPKPKSKIMSVTDHTRQFSASTAYRYPMYKDKRHASDSCAKMYPNSTKGRVLCEQPPTITTVFFFHWIATT